MMKNPSVLLIDNQDSFTFNLVESFRRAGVEKVIVIPAAEVSISQVERFDKIVFSPGPGIPREHPVCFDIMEKYARRKSLLGVCLGHQIMGLFYGARLEHLERPHHGRQAVAVKTAVDPVFAEVQQTFSVGLYHSWQLSEDNFPDELEITARDYETGAILSIRHRHDDVHGLQFHPESILTPEGDCLLKSFLQL